MNTKVRQTSATKTTELSAIVKPFLARSTTMKNLGLKSSLKHHFPIKKPLKHH